MGQRSRQRAAQQRRHRQLRRGALAAALAIVVVAAGAVAFGGGGDDPLAPGGTRVTMTEYAFDPDPIAVDAGDVVLDVVNEGAIAHNLLVRGLGKGAPDLASGESFALDLGDPEPGTYAVVCDLPGHEEAGMVTELIVR